MLLSIKGRKEGMEEGSAAVDKREEGRDGGGECCCR